MVSTTRTIRIRGERSASVESVAERYAWVRPALVAYFRRRRLADEAEAAVGRVLRVMTRTLPRVHPCAARVRQLVFGIARDQEFKLRERRRAVTRWSGRLHGSGEFDVIASGDDPQALFDRLWVQALVLGCLNRLHRERLDLYATLEATVPRKGSVAEVARAEGTSPAAVRKRVWRAKARLAVYLRQEVRRYAHGREDVARELRFFARLMGLEALAERVGLTPIRRRA